MQGEPSLHKTRAELEALQIGGDRFLRLSIGKISISQQVKTVRIIQILAGIFFETFDGFVVCFVASLGLFVKSYARPK